MTILYRDHVKKILGLLIFVSIILSFFNLSWSFGFSSGWIISSLNLMILEIQIDHMMFFKKFNYWTGIPLYIFKSFSFGIPFVVAILWPQWFNLSAALGGLISLKVLFYIVEFTLKKETHAH